MQTFTAEVTEKETINDDTILLTITAPEDFTYQPGQYVMFKIVKGTGSKPRAYSILSSEPGKLHFVIRLIEGGFAGEVFKETKVGDNFEVKGPLGHLTFAPDSSDDHWLIGCGCGIAPLYCMIKKYLPLHPDKKFTLLFGTKKKKDLLFHDELQELEKANRNFTYLPTITREDWEGKMGRVQKHLPEDLNNKTFYICGLKELVEETKDLLIQKEVNPKNIHFERYS